MERYYHFPSLDGINNTIRTGGKGSLTAKHNYEYIAIPENWKGDSTIQNKHLGGIKMTNEKSFKYVELFAGIKGFGKALDKLGGECLFTSEIDKYAQQAIKAMYPNENLHGDITKIANEDIPSHDVLVGGMPCQAFSLAGKRLGFEDTRGTLFFEIARIAKHHQPKAILIENVKGLISHESGKTLNVMIHALNDIGYTIDFTILNSKFFNVPQSRERIFIIALRNDLITPEKWIIEGNNIVAKGKRRLLEQDVRTFNFDWPEQTEVTTRLKDILEKVVDERYYLSDEKTASLLKQLAEKDNKGSEIAVKGDLIDRSNPQAQYGFSNDNMFTLRCAQVHGVAEPQNENIEKEESKILDVSQMRRDGEICVYTDIAPTLAARDYKEPRRVLEPQDDTDRPIMLGRVDGINGHDCRKRVYSVEGICPTPSGLGMGGNTEPKIAENQSDSDKPQIKKMGNVNPSGNGMNGVVYDAEAGLAPTLTTNKGEGIKFLHSDDVVDDDIDDIRSCSTRTRAYIGKPETLEIRKDDVSNTITSVAKDAYVFETPKYRIRKLIPLETWRLQSFSDDDFFTVKNAGISDSQLYKQAGNAVTVNTVEAVGKKLMKYLNQHK